MSCHALWKSLSLAFLCALFCFATPAVAQETVLYDQPFNAQTGLSNRIIQSSTSRRWSFLQDLQAWSLSSNPGPGRRARTPRTDLSPSIFTGANGSYWLGRTFFGFGVLRFPDVNIAGETGVKLRLRMAAAQEGTIRGSYDSQNHFESGEYLRIYVNRRMIDAFDGGNPLRLRKRFSSSSALTSTRTNQVIPTTFGSFEYDLSAYFASRGVSPSTAEISIVYTASSEFVGIDDVQIVADGGVVDNCPSDPNKTEPGVCGCGVADDDTDGDGTEDCIDACPADPTKDADAGICGCGVADSDSDGDGTADCNDGCPADGAKIDPGVCGCGVADDDSDGDGTLDCNDNCPGDGSKTDPGVCGCGIPDIDLDGNGSIDCVDNCPADPNKVDPGVCGCGVPDSDTDGDGTLDCNDGCPADGAKTSAGACGCGVSDADTDGDGTADCNDGCPADGGKTAPGTCGCGVPDSDGDGDGTLDCNDGCPTDGAKTAPGQCGCNVPDVDTDGDGSADCSDNCPNDGAKTEAGICGCGTPDTDTDGDGTADCNDGCPNDGAKTAAGVCGCGTADTDSDGDTVADCNDGCPNDGGKQTPGVCGCGVSDVDSDGDGTEDCNDSCPADPDKTDPGACGCGVADDDANGNGIADCNELSKECFIGDGDAIGDDTSFTDDQASFPVDLTGSNIAGIAGCEFTSDGASLGMKELRMIVTGNLRFPSDVVDFRNYPWEVWLFTTAEFYNEPQSIEPPPARRWVVTPSSNIVCAAPNTPPCVPEVQWGLGLGDEQQYELKFDLSTVPGLGDTPIPPGDWIMTITHSLLTDRQGNANLALSVGGPPPLGRLITTQPPLADPDGYFNGDPFQPGFTWAMSMTEMVPETEAVGRLCKP